MSHTHTPGDWTAFVPWREPVLNKYGRRNDHRLMVLHPDGERLICMLGIGSVNPRGWSIDSGEQEANAYLIAAAPKLLAACKAVLAIPADEPGRVAILAPMLAAAVRKAEGKQ